MKKKFTFVLCMLMVLISCLGFSACSDSADGAGRGIEAISPTVAAGEETEQVSMVRDNRFIGVTYSTWFPPYIGNKWGTPVLGEYTSSNREVIRRHALWLADAGVDFIVIDWTNNMTQVWGDSTSRPDLYAIESATAVVYEEFAKIDNAPKIVIAGGICLQSQAEAFFDGTMQRRVNEIWENFYGNPEYEKLNFIFEGKPLMMAYLMTSAAIVADPEDIFQDDRITIKYFTGFLGDQPNLLRPGTRISKYGYWSWWERGNNAYAVNEDGSAECVTISAAWYGNGAANEVWKEENGAVGRRDGQTFIEQWDLAIELDPEVVLVQSFNEWVREEYDWKAAEELDPVHSNDIEPSVELGYKYLNILKEKGYLYKKGKA